MSWFNLIIAIIATVACIIIAYQLAVVGVVVLLIYSAYKLGTRRTR